MFACRKTRHAVPRRVLPPFWSSRHFRVGLLVRVPTLNPPLADLVVRDAAHVSPYDEEASALLDPARVVRAGCGKRILGDVARPRFSESARRRRLRSPRKMCGR